MDFKFFDNPPAEASLGAFGDLRQLMRTADERCCAYEKLRLPRGQWQSCLSHVSNKIFKSYPTPFQA